LEDPLLSDNKDIVSTEKSRREGILSGVMLLAASTFLCKIIGLFFKIPIINIVGIDGMAYFSSAYNIYMLLNSIAAAGLPVALSILVAKNRALGYTDNIKKIFLSALTLFLLLGFAGTLLLYLGADSYSKFIGIEASAPAVKAIAPTLLFICISGAIRGYFQGHEIMLPTALSQLMESLGKLALGVGFALYAVKIGLDSSYTAAAAVIGLSAGVFLSVVYLFVRLLFFSRKANRICSTDNSVKDGNKKILYDLFIIAFPITLSSCVTSLTSLADTALITNRLVSGGFSSDAAVTLYSSYTNLAIPLFNLPPALITAIGVSLIPALTSAITRNAEGESKKIFTSAVKLCNTFAIPAAAGIAVFAKPILLAIYPNEAEACNFASPLLSILSAAIVFSCLTTVCNATLQAYMKPALPIISMASGALIKIAVEYILVGSDIGIYGAPISTVACTLTILVMDLIFIAIYTPQRVELFSLLKIFVSTAMSVGLSALLYKLLLCYDCSDLLTLAIAIISAICLYIIFALLFGVVSYADMISLGVLNSLAKKLKKMKLIK
jgi:stage V sporulation protein B